MPTPPRPPVHRLQAILLGQLRELAPDVSYDSIGAALGARGLACSRPHVSKLMTGELGATADELFIIQEHYGLEVVTRAYARMSGLTVVDAEAEHHDTSLVDLALDVGVTTGQLQQAVREATRDGHIDTREHEGLQELLDAKQVQLDAMRHQLAKATTGRRALRVAGR